MSQKRIPDPMEFPGVYVDTRVCGGDPMIEGVSPSIPTLANQVLVGDTVECVSDWFGVSVDDVRIAVAYWNKYGRQE